MYNPNENDNTFNNGFNGAPENDHGEQNISAQGNVEEQAAEPQVQNEVNESHTAQDAEVHSEYKQEASSYTPAYTNPTNYSGYQANYKQQPYKAYH